MTLVELKEDGGGVTDSIDTGVTDTIDTGVTDTVLLGNLVAKGIIAS